MDKSLTPLIAVCAFVILLTIVVINLNSGNHPRLQNNDTSSGPMMQLRPGEQNKPTVAVSGEFKKEEAALINAGEMLGKARTALAKGQTGKAEDLLRTVLVFDPDNVQALSLLGGILYYSSRYSEAELLFRRQIKLNPRSALAYNRLGSVLAKQKKFKEAIDNASIAVGISPDSGEAHINLAGMYAVTGNKKKALKHFQKAYELIKYAILPLSFDQAFDSIRNTPEFQKIISEAQGKMPDRSRSAKSAKTVTENVNKTEKAVTTPKVEEK